VFQETTAVHINTQHACNGSVMSPAERKGGREREREREGRGKGDGVRYRHSRREESQ